jgi:hypothetical protein
MLVGEASGRLKAGQVLPSALEFLHETALLREDRPIEPPFG